MPERIERVRDTGALLLPLLVAVAAAAVGVDARREGDVVDGFVAGSRPGAGGFFVTADMFYTALVPVPDFAGRNFDLL